MKHEDLENMVKRYIVSSFQYNATVNHELLSSLDKYAKTQDAEILLLPMRGKSIEEDIVPQRLAQYNIISNDYKLNHKIQVSSYEILPQQIDPITGLARFTQNDVSTIFASPKQRLKVIPNSNKDLPKVLMTTGAITHPNYRDNRIGKIAAKDHVYGAIMVEVVNNTQYHYRQLVSSKNGTFYDINMYSKKGIKRPEAVVFGDWHVKDTNLKVLKASIEMVQYLKPKRVFLHDLFNGHSISHHNVGKIVSLSNEYTKSGLSLEQELSDVARDLDYLRDNFPKGTEIIIVASNHDEFLTRYLEDGRFINEPQNTLIASKLLTAYIEGKYPLKEGVGMFTSTKGIKFLTRDDDYKVLGWQLGSHGDLGANGAKGSINSKELAHGKSITAHTHTPEIQRNTLVVGTSTNLKLSYNRGYSSWMNTHAVLYSNGKTQLINIIDGKWKS